VNSCSQDCNARVHGDPNFVLQIRFTGSFSPPDVFNKNINSMIQEPQLQPSLLGLRASFGFGDRLGFATPGHIAACVRGKLLPIFAQQSVREMTRTQRKPAEVMTAARKGIVQEHWSGAWGADADHLKTSEDVQNLAAAGFTFFTIDPSAHVQNEADHLTGGNLEAATEQVVQSGAFESLKQIEKLYLNQSHDLPGIGKLSFAEKELLCRAVVKYGKAIDYAAKMAGWIGECDTPAGAEIEVSVDETETPTSPLEHLFIGLELKRRGVKVVSVAPRFVGEFEKGIDYKGDLHLFESTLAQHVAIARYCGPYKISVHSGSDKFRVYPILGRVCGDLLHVKTAGTSYLEALRVVARKASESFREIVQFSRNRFATDRASYHVSADLSRVPGPQGLGVRDCERVYLDEEGGRQILHVTFGSVLTLGRNEKGRAFKEAIVESLQSNPGLHKEVLAAHLGKHIQLLQAG
jgi:tagaturonate epimerase